MDIRLENLSIGYNKGKAVATDINIGFRGGDLSCIIGKNGTGKSTLLKTITGFLPAKQGTVLFGDKDSATMTRHERSIAVSIVLTGAPDIRNFTVREMVGVGRSPYTGFFGTLTPADKQVVDESMSMAGVTPLADRKTYTLSDGERQKVMIARALAQQTPAILLDEPTAFLDYPSKVDLIRLLGRLAHEQQKTIIMSTHDLALAVRFADRLFLMSSGSLNPVNADDVKAYIASCQQ